ncbi:MAG: hypothetical protein CM15mP77_0030 [Synechococcus sp.]|nr:MAG: hypothetical protein CM15mP77_0030 [Synechococcus sp.]
MDSSATHCLIRFVVLATWSSDTAASPDNVESKIWYVVMINTFEVKSRLFKHLGECGELTLMVSLCSVRCWSTTHTCFKAWTLDVAERRLTIPTCIYIGRTILCASRIHCSLSRPSDQVKIL